MSSSIWTRCAGASRLRPLRQTPWRVVEAQHLVATRKLVDSLDEQAVLEALIESSRPSLTALDGRTGRSSSQPLLATPFRYPPLRHGSRFGTRHDPGIWYGALNQGALFAEAAYYRFVFLSGTSADLGTLTAWHTVFRVPARTRRGVDLTGSPFDEYRAAISSPVAYAASQALGQAMRADGVELARYRSARDPDGGINVAILAPGVFGQARPQDFQVWHSASTTARVEFARRDWAEARAFAFARTPFEVDGRLPMPAL